MSVISEKRVGKFRMLAIQHVPLFLVIGQSMGLALGVLDFQALGPGSMLQMEVCSLRFFSCTPVSASYSYLTITGRLKISQPVNPPILAPNYNGEVFLV